MTIGGLAARTEIDVVGIVGFIYGTEEPGAVEMMSLAAALGTEPRELFPEFLEGAGAHQHVEGIAQRLSLSSLHLEGRQVEHRGVLLKQLDGPLAGKLPATQPPEDFGVQEQFFRRPFGDRPVGRVLDQTVELSFDQIDRAITRGRARTGAGSDRAPPGDHPPGERRGPLHQPAPTRPDAHERRSDRRGLAGHGRPTSSPTSRSRFKSASRPGRLPEPDSMPL